MAPRRKPAARPAAASLVQRTPLAEWIAAGVGLVLTLAVLGYSVWEVVDTTDAPPALEVRPRAVHAQAGGHVVEIEVLNDSYATAADVEVVGTIEQGGAVVEERRATFDYVPAQGSARGGLVFLRDPEAGVLRLRTEGYVEP